MFGIDVKIKCPYCNKILRTNLGITEYYKYKGKEVIKFFHTNCGEFICQYVEENSYTFVRYNGYKLSLIKYIQPIVEKYIENNQSEEDIINNTIIELKNILKKEDKNFNLNKDINDIKVIVQIILGQYKNDSSLWSKKLTNNDIKELEFVKTICW